MKFGDVALETAHGAVLAHRTLDLKKGTKLDRVAIDALKAAGIEMITVARLEKGDVDEDAAAARIGAALDHEGLDVGSAATGRVNIHAQHAGLFQPDKALIDRLNAIDPAITLATLADFAPVRAGQMVATIKIIPLAVEGPSLEAALDVLNGGKAIKIAPFAPNDVTLIQTVLPATSPKMLEKTRRVTEDRLAISGSSVREEIRVTHDVDALSNAIGGARQSDLILVFGASAVIDRQDVIPAAIERSGGRVDYFGMPVDPGNLLLIGQRFGKPIIGAPGCARSPKENGFDWVLDRILAGFPVDGRTVQSFGVGGLLAEIETRPRPRQTFRRQDDLKVDIVLLAAGRSTRMAPENKLLSDIRPGVPMVRHVAETAVSAADGGRVFIVTGHREADVRRAVGELDVCFVPNPEFAEGLSTSLKAGFAAAQNADGVLVMLGDQPFVRSEDLKQLVAKFRRHDGRSVIAAGDGPKRRNPVIIPTRYSRQIEALVGDAGAGPFLSTLSDAVILVDLGERASFDTDTPAAFAAAKQYLKG